MQDGRSGDLARGRDEVVGERAGEEAPVAGVGELLVQRRADPVRKPAADLAVDEGGVQARAGIVHGDVLVDPDPAGVVDLHPAHVEDEAVGARAVHPIVFVGWIEPGHRPEDGLAKPRPGMLGEGAGRPVGDARGPAQRYRVLGILGREDPAAGEHERLGRDVEPGTRDAGEALAQLHRREMRGARDRAGETARVVAGRDRPRVLLGVVLHVHRDVVKLHPQHVGDDLGEDGAMPLALRHRGDVRRDRPDRIDGDRRACRRAVFGPARARSPAVRAMVM